MKTYQADLLMLLVTVFWGASYLFMDMGLDSIAEFNLIALRFGLAFVMVSPILLRNRHKINLNTLKYSFTLGFLLFIVFTFITFGLGTTTTSNAGFLIALTVVFVPILSIFILKKKMGSRLIISIALSMIGIGFLTIQLPFTIIVGDLLCIMGALFYALHIITTSIAVKKADALNIGILQLGFAGLFGLIFSFVFETPVFPNTPIGWIAILALSIFCTALGFVLQVVAQKYTSPTRTGLIFSMEPVFAALCGYLFINEVMSSVQFFGALLILLGIILTTIRNNTQQPQLTKNDYKRARNFERSNL